MKSNAKLKLIIIGIIFILLSISTTNLSLVTDNNTKNLGYNDDFTLDKDNLKISTVSGPIHVNNNWTAVKAAGKCTGTGTYSDPFIIQNLVINGEGTESCIFIENSQVFFRIKNCRLYNAYGDGGPRGGGIYFINVSNGYIVNNQVYDNTYVGINLVGCNNITILNNDASHQKVGIALIVCDNTTIKGNTLNYNNADGSLFLYYSSYINISDNSFNHNHHGIVFWYSSDNTISRNFFKFNDNGIWIYEYSYRNMVYLNCFSNNSFTALDDKISGSTNHWDNGTVGNYWSDYTGVDSDENGIGDTPYNITQSMYNSVVSNQDNFPLMECPLPVPVDNGEELPLELIIIISVISGGALIGVAALLIVRHRRKIAE